MKSFLLLFVFTCVGIFLHELGHHLLGVPSLLALSRNYPLVPVTADNIDQALIGTLAGPMTNLVLAYLGLFLYKIGDRTKINFGLFLGISNCFLALSGAVINLIVDLLSGNMGNDLEKVSAMLRLNIFLLPITVFILSLIPFRTFWRVSKNIAPRKFSFVIVVFMAWLTGGAFLMTLDSLFTIRIG